ncbi:hypothetical protein JR316_0002937 [Psilocybe cubensis]|uniref:Uncharacterized protein n=2 Tax=Psilocybe cubensis TaxID=181762 RepID=A0A8H7Y1S9_PSICU|nr:hypothetical protein JR316_0002937 [Psilocybe cubensis]KAH9483469.1 hypothetical protein JR316_0002937 [Psilocybe cubensis]
MSPTGRVFPSIEQVSREHAEHGRHVWMISSNLSFPSRYYTQVPWSGPSTPLVAVNRENMRRFKKIFARTTHSSRRVAFSSSYDGFHITFEANFRRRMKDLIAHTKLKLRQNIVKLREQIIQNTYLSLPLARTNVKASPSSSTSYLPIS